MGKEAAVSVPKKKTIKERAVAQVKSEGAAIADVGMEVDLGVGGGESRGFGLIASAKISVRLGFAAGRNECGVRSNAGKIKYVYFCGFTFSQCLLSEGI